MFECFFPRPKALLLSTILWTIGCILLWFTLGKPLGESLTLGQFFGLTSLDFSQLEALQKEAVAFSPSTSPDRVQEVQTMIAALERAKTFWTYQYIIPCYLLFAGAWYMISTHKWKGWAVLGSTFITFATWFLVQLDVMINEWFGGFYDMIQNMFKSPGSISADQYYGFLITFFYIAAVAVLLKVFISFFVQHYVFRWRTGLNERYTEHWQKIKHIEGADQRVQDDTMRFANITQELGVGFIDAVMTLIAFLPILWVLSDHVSEIPIIGPVSQGLVIVAVIWSIIGTVFLFFTGRPLVGLQFHNQRVEAAYREELVFGKKNEDRGTPPLLYELFADVRKNYFRLYLSYMYFNVVRYSYLQAGVLVPYIALAPSLLSAETIGAGFSLGVMQQTVRAFGRVESSFQYLVLNWSTIVEWQSIYKRLRALDAAINNEPLPTIDRELLKAGQ